LRERPAQHVRRPRREAGDDHADADGLLLKEQHAQRFRQHRRQTGVQIAHRLLPAAPPQIRVHRATLDRAGAHDGHLDDDVLEAGRLETGQHLLLRPALHLKRSRGVALLQHPVDGRVVQRDAFKVGHGASHACDVPQRLA
jgi:hypothetical protein